MYLYRAKEIGNKDRLKEICLRIIEIRDYDQILGVLPHIRILRSDEFFDPLLKLLNEGRADQKAAAALALGCLGDDRCIPHLSQAYYQAGESEKYRNQNLRAAVIEALGELASKQAVEALLEVAAESPLKNESFGELEFIISSLGQLAQQGIEGAEDQLVILMNSEENPVITSLALTEVMVSYWHRPNEVPDELFDQISESASNGQKEVVRAAVTSLSSLIQLGCNRARDCLAIIEKTASENKKDPEHLD